MAEYIDREKLINDGIEKGFCDWYDEIKYAQKANVIVIPEGATNGDMIKAMFPNCEQKENIHNGYFEMYFDGDFGNPSYMRVREYWWNAKYKKEVEE